MQLMTPLPADGTLTSVCDALHGLLCVCCCSFWIEPNAASVGYQVEAPGRDNFTLGYAGLQQCLDECDMVSW